MTVKLEKLFQESVDLNIKQLTYISNFKTDTRNWANQLMQLDLGEAAKQVFVTLLELRSLNCSDLSRWKILQNIEPDLQHLFSSLEHHYLNNAMIDTLRDQQIADLVLEIKCQHALLYRDMAKRVQHQLENHKFSIFELSRKKKLTILRTYCAYAVIKLLTDLLYSLQLIYFDEPKHFWHTAYDNIWMARAFKFDKEKIDVSLEKYQAQQENIENAFIELALLSLLNNHKLRQEDLKHLKNCLPFWLHLVKISNDPHPEAKFCCNLFEDRAPSPVLSKFTDQRDSIYLNATELLNYIESTMQPNSAYFSKEEQQNLNIVIKSHILTTLNNDGVRKNTRFADEGNVELALGISAAHYFLSGAKHFKESLMRESDLTIQNSALNISDLANDQEWKLSSKTFEQRYNAEITKIYQSHIVNRSNNGFCLSWQNSLPKHLRTGDFILLREQSDQPWSGALIRWLKNTDQQNVEFGVEIVVNKMAPVAVSLGKKTAEVIYHPAILTIDDNNKFSLILPSPQIFHENQNLTLRFGTEELRIFLKQCISLVQSCARFDFDLLEQSKLTLLNDYFESQVNNIDTQDLWEALK